MTSGRSKENHGIIFQFQKRYLNSIDQLFEKTLAGNLYSRYQLLNRLESRLPEDQPIVQKYFERLEEKEQSHICLSQTEILILANIYYYQRNIELALKYIKKTQLKKFPAPLLPQSTFLMSANTHYKFAEEHGDIEAIYQLGSMHLYGKGVRQDLGLAGQFFQSAALLNHQASQEKLATLYAHGVGVTQDLRQAAVWYRQSHANFSNAPDKIKNKFESLRLQHPNDTSVLYHMSMTFRYPPSDLRSTFNRLATEKPAEFYDLMAEDSVYKVKELLFPQNIKPVFLKQMDRIEKQNHCIAALNPNNVPNPIQQMILSYLIHQDYLKLINQKPILKPPAPKKTMSRCCLFFSGEVLETKHQHNNLKLSKK